jgi:hypothetical protein
VLLTREDPPVVKEQVDTVVVPKEPPAKPPPEAPAVADVTLRLETTPPGAQVLVGGAVVGVTPLPLTRKQGEVVEVKLALDGYQPETKQVSFAAGAPTVSIVLQKAAVPPKPPEPKPDLTPTPQPPKPDVKASPDKPKPDVKASPDKPKPDVKATPDKPKPKPKKDDLKDVPF